MGTITMDYRSAGKDWFLSVTDDGVGISKGSDAPKAGLDNGIVEALARNLQSEIQLSDADPGTAITISHQENTAL
jgi:two-component sensor histidine kinase